MFTESVGRLLKPQEIIADIVAFPRRNENYLLGIYERKCPTSKESRSKLNFHFGGGFFMRNEDMSRYKVWRAKWKRRVNMENLAIYGITTLVMAILPILAHMS
ncbi:hypothetical protein UP17_06525 [Peribacillus simplex]|nr:hypothetical protein UP17_06525 [Peribacillus simplex]